MSQIVWVEPKPAKPVQNGLKQPKRAKKSLKLIINNDKYSYNNQGTF